ncbi:MAG TPA: carboxypeptidase-like regulatory domain-containing protein, partial [Acidimicrobiia bacterium]|nr:carboxypeptidase-like regulatory domain-containing protein [Acidimicrobiia bacterium]
MPWRGSVDVTAGALTTCFIELRSAGTITGRVQSTSGEPVAGALLVGYAGKNVACRTRSDAAGAFVLAPLPPGLALVWAHHKTAGWGRVEHDLGDPGQVVVTLTSGPTAQGRCVDQSGALLPGVDVELRMIDAAGRVFVDAHAAHSGDDGRFRVANVATEADLWVTAQKAGCRGASGRFAAAADVELVLTTTIDDCILAGRVVDPEGRPVAGATVLVHGSSIGGAYGGATSDDGRFAITDLSRCTMRVTLEHPEFALTTIAQVVSVGGRQELGDLTIVRGGRVRVAVDRPGSAAPSGSVYLLDADGRSASTFELVNGLAVSATIPPGEYQALIAASHCETCAFRVTVVAGCETTLARTLRPGLPIAVAFELPTTVPTEAPLVGTLTRGGETLYRFTV